MEHPYLAQPCMKYLEKARGIGLGLPEGLLTIRLTTMLNNQHGFRAKRSTETQLSEDIGKHLGTDKAVDMAILDFYKAFDKVPHKRLMSKLNY